MAETTVATFYPGNRSTVRLDMDGNAFVIGSRGATAVQDQYRFRKDPDLTQVKSVVVGDESIWFLKTNGEVWLQGFHHWIGKPRTKGSSRPTSDTERKPELYNDKPVKIPLPKMVAITGTGTRIGGVDEQGAAWAWGDARDLGVNFSQAEGWKPDFPGKIRKMYFANYDQIIIEDEEGISWGRTYTGKLDGPINHFTKLELPAGHKIVSVGESILASRSSQNIGKLFLFSWRRDLGSEDNGKIFVSEASINLPDQDSGSGQVTVEEKNISFLSKGKIYDLPFEHRGEQLRIKSWSERKIPEPIKKYWYGEKHSFYESVTGLIYASGENRQGELGFPFHFSVPVKISGLSGMTAIAAAGDVSMALNQKGELFTWGTGTILGDGKNFHQTPGHVPSPPLVKISAEPFKVLAISQKGEVYTWGNANDYIPPGFRDFLSRKIKFLTGTKRPSEKIPLRVEEIDHAINVSPAQTASYKFTARVLDQKRRIWVWKAVDLSNPFEGIFPSFDPPYVWKTLAKGERDIFPFGYNNEIILTDDGQLIGKKSEFDFYIEGVTQIPVDNATVRFELPKVKDVIQLTIKEQEYGLVLHFETGDVAYLNDKKFERIDKSVNRIFPANVSDLIYLKDDGSLIHVDYSETKTIHKFPREELTSIKEISAGNDHYLLLKTDGTVWAWGKNEKFQLGLTGTGPAEFPRRLSLE